MNRIERNKFLAYVGHTYSDIQIWGQYEQLIDFIFTEFPKTKRRFDEISLPVLFTLSHALELALKENIKFYKQYHESSLLQKFDNWTQLLKSHNIEALTIEFKNGFQKLHSKVNATTDIKKEFNKYYKELEKLVEILNRNTETYRYSLKLDNSGSPIKKSIDHSKTIDFLVVQNLFKQVKILLIAAPNSLAIYTDYIDFKTKKPDYIKGKGYLFYQKLHYSVEFLQTVKEKLNNQLTPISNNLWMDEETGENFEIQICENNIFVIAI